MKSVDEIISNKQLKILTNQELDGDIRITCYYFNPIDQKRWFVIFTKGLGWEHLSISQDNRTPTWDVMCRVKDIFWNEDEVCVQYHPRKEDYVNMHEHCLHIWRPYEDLAILPTPPSIMVGIKDINSKQAQAISKIMVNSLNKEELLEVCEKRGIVPNRKMKRGVKK